MEKENVNHPAHYNQHPAGIECIDIIRHYPCDIANAIKYLWRAGLKTELGKDETFKEMEDLKKALWYIEDYLQTAVPTSKVVNKNRIYSIFKQMTGHTVEEVATGYCQSIATAMGNLLCVGIIRKGELRHIVGWKYLLKDASDAIRHRLQDINI